jgi:hypothetical protein
MKLVQRRGQIKVPVGNFELYARRFELIYDRLAQAALKIRVAFAAKDSAAGETIFVNRTFAGYVVRTPTPIHRLYIFIAQLRDKIYQLRRRHKKPVVKIIKVTALPARLAHPAKAALITNLQVQPAVNLSYSSDEPLLCFTSCHHFLFALILAISSKL